MYSVCVYMCMRTRTRICLCVSVLFEAFTHQVVSVESLDTLCESSHIIYASGIELSLSFVASSDFNFLDISPLTQCYKMNICI